MSWTYTNDPSSSQRDEVRFLIGDTDSTKAWTLQDGEILYAIAQYPNNILLAAAVCAEAIVARFKGNARASKSLDDLSISWDTAAFASYKEIANTLRNRANMRGVRVFVGGISRSQKRTTDSDPDRMDTAAKIDGMNKLTGIDGRSETDF